MIASAESCVAEAFDRFRDFLAVQGPSLSAEALDLLQIGLGLDEDARHAFVRRVESDFDPAFKAPQLLLGFILGLSAAQLARERGERE